MGNKTPVSHFTAIDLHDSTQSTRRPQECTRTCYEHGRLGCGGKSTESARKRAGTVADNESIGAGGCRKEGSKEGRKEGSKEARKEGSKATRHNDNHAHAQNHDNVQTKSERNQNTKKKKKNTVQLV